MPAKNRTVGAIPGYSGHVPYMRNHLVGHSYTPATVRAASCGKLIRKEDYYSALPLTIESRPTGREFFYAQAAVIPDHPPEKVAIVPRVSKRRPPLEIKHASGMMDVRQMKTCVGTTDECVSKTYKTTSMSELPYKDRSLSLHKPHEPMEVPTPAIKSIPGYTGHQHAAQHVFAKSHGSLGREIILDNQTPDKTTMKELLYYADPRPVGKILTEKHKIPGYQGYIPAKNNHVYGKTSGKASDLAAAAEKTLAKRENANAMVELVEIPPQGRPDLYAQSLERYHMDESEPLNVRVNKARVHIDFQERRPDYRLKEPIESDIKEVMQAKHHVHGYTGHVHASQHVYGRSYGKITRDLHDQPAEPVTSEKYIEYADNRPFIDQTGELLIP
ncbi:hypothetical protein KP509_30G028500 [Ceratopteris richardii]|uniref:Uncharacterized protein n=1 Tax=Ceratopteris richardii TaxID=49495 RepID=A0A8T2R156_CERRI|nr:hypothetical protein KP509_30G028500 [Ceratopteris richardii]